MDTLHVPQWPVYVPRDDRLEIDPASGITGRPRPALAAPHQLLLDYEGNRFRAANIVTWADRVLHAIGRASMDYPTIARQAVDPAGVVLVGWYSLWEGLITVLPGQRDTVQAWVMGDPTIPIPDEELWSTDGASVQRRALRDAFAMRPAVASLAARELRRYATNLPPWIAVSPDGTPAQGGRSVEGERDARV